MNSRIPGVSTVLVFAAISTASAQPVRPEKFAGNCSDTGCHADLSKGPVLHSPVEKGACDACHQPKEGAEHKFQFTTAPDKLCAECHDDLLEGLTLVHGPVAVGQCTACHDPHRSDRPKLLKMEERAACLDCHSDVGDRLKAAKVVHSPVESGCTTCHNPHGSKNKMLLSAAGSQVCLECHDDVAKHLEANPHRHGPVDSGDCTACHAAHASAGPLLTVNAYPSTFYSPYKEDQYKLCFECHEAEAFASAETEDATAFRNGTRNLHFLHVNKSSKGRTCRACHDPHASRNDKHIAESVAFGKWKIPLNFRPTSTGGSCASGCHRAYAYDREQPVKNLTTP